MKTLIVTTAFFLTAFLNTGNKLIGRWQTHPSPKGNITTVDFKEDNSFETFINKKPFASGEYIFENNIFSFTDNGCNGIEGTYRIIFFSNDDSLRIELVADSCIPRSQGMPKLVMGRIKK